MSSILSNQIRLSGYISESIVDGPGIRYVIFTQGCLKNCYKCHNPETQNLLGGQIHDIDNLVTDIRRNPLIQGVTFSGGEPFLQADKILAIMEKLKDSNLDFLVYSGYYYEELIKKNNPSINKVLEKADYLIDGPFIFKEKNLNLLFRGSNNQRIIDLQKTKTNKIIEIIENFD